MSRRPLKRGKPLAAISDKRRAELAQEGVPFPTSSFRSKRAAWKLAKSTGPDAHTVELVLMRDAYQCVICADPLHGLRGVDYSIHHRKLRSAGVDHRASNLISLCGSGTTGCHGEVHAQRNKARKGGWIVLPTDDPAVTPVLHRLHGRVLLGVDGSVTRAKEGN